ncbi:MAG: hypothetical protein PWQ78_346 [Petrotoga sp.]|nr:hypothetical protein [Petrotoga sp.]
MGKYIHYARKRGTRVNPRLTQGDIIWIDLDISRDGETRKDNNIWNLF